MRYKVVDTATGALLPRGQEGEVRCTGPNVMVGYLNNPLANAGAFDADGWFCTGDIGFFDAEGYMTLTDRLKELIKYKGFQVLRCYLAVDPPSAWPLCLSQSAITGPSHTRVDEASTSTPVLALDSRALNFLAGFVRARVFRCRPRSSKRCC
jgi:hypothetical protein